MKRPLLLISTAVALMAAWSPAAELHDGLVSHWPLDAINADTTPDAAYTNTMTVVGSPIISPGKVGNAFTLVGPSTYLTNLHSPDGFLEAGLPIYSAGAYTICMWVKGTNQTAKYLYSEGSRTSVNPLLILQTGQAAANNARFDVIIRTDGNATLLNHAVSTTVVFDDQWHHIAWVDDNGRARLYVDGQLDPANFNYSRSGTFTFNSAAIGTLVRANISTPAIFNGQIDEVAMWERALSQAEVQAVMASGVPAPGPVGPPIVFAVPADTTRQMGDWALWSVTASARRPHNVLSYQWFRNDAEIPGATARTYQTPHLTPAESGDHYRVMVSNGLGSTNTPNATLTVVADPPANLRNGCVGYWPLDEINQVGPDLMTRDLYSHTDFVLMGFFGTTDVVPGHTSNALSFDFVTRFGYRTNGFAIYSSTNYTVSMWVQADFTTQNDRRVFSEGSPTNNSPLFTLGTDAAGTSPSASVYISSDSGAGAFGTRNSTRPVFDNQWHLLTWTDINGKGRLYVDGVLDETDYTYTRGAATVSQTAIGAVLRGTNTGNFFFGNIDEVATWNRALTWTEIQEVMTNGVPAPLGEIPPSIVVQPFDRTNNVFVGDNISFSVLANGTFPLAYQWYKDNAPVVGNPSANSATLLLNNAQLTANGSYFAAVSNGGGSVTSSVVQLALQTFTPATSGEVLNLDIGLAGTPNVQPGFEEFTLALNGTNYNSVGVTLLPIGPTALQARNRTDILNNPPALTQASIYNDFVFGGGNVEGNGLTVLIERLAPNTPYGLTIWSFDPVSTGARVSDWTETASSMPVVLATAYTFYATNLPASDYQYTFGGLVTSSPTGKLQIEGRRNAASVSTSGAADIGVFINALRLVARPTGTRIHRFEYAAPNVRLHVAGDYPGQPIEIEQNPTLAPAGWTPATGATPVLTNGPLVVFEVPAGAGNIFFRAKSHQTW